jgi:hypothetical protein
MSEIAQEYFGAEFGSEEHAKFPRILARMLTAHYPTRKIEAVDVGPMDHRCIRILIIVDGEWDQGLIFTPPIVPDRFCRCCDSPDHTWENCPEDD